MIIFALDTGMRRGEMLWLRWNDIEARSGWIRVRGETAKSGRTRWVPIGTTRLQAVLDFLRMDASGHAKPDDAPVFSNAVGEPIRFFRTAWEMAVLRANGIELMWGKENQRRTLTPACREAFKRLDLRWHDLRHEYASRLVERGVPLSQVRDLLGHASITTTERYDNQTQEALFEAAKRLETRESFKNLSRSPTQAAASDETESSDDDAKAQQGLKKEGGVSDGDRTRNIRSHSPALYR